MRSMFELSDPKVAAEITKEELLEIVKASMNDFQERMRAEQKQKVRSYRELNKVAKKGQILFTGSSLMEQFPINEIAMSTGDTRVIYNRGIGGTKTDDFIEEIDAVLLDLKPSKLFINIGTNDINERPDGSDWREHLYTNYDKIMSIINEKLPDCETYVMAYYPVNPEVNPQLAAFMLKTRTNETVNEVNIKVKELAEKHGFTYIEVNSGIRDAKGYQKAEYSKEGMHMYPSGYLAVYEELKKYI